MSKKPSLLRRLFSGVWRTIALLYALLLIIVLLGVPLGVYLAFFSGPHVNVRSNSALVWAPTGNLVEQRSGGVGSLVGSLVSQPQSQSVVRDLITALDRADNDSRIQLAFLKLDDLGGAQPGQIQDLVAAIDRFKRSGKTVVAWSPSYDQAQYELASHADTVYLDPLGYVFVHGYGAFHRYYKDAIDKLGVTVNVFRVGKYKSYVEPYTRNDMSPAARQDNRKWLNTLWHNYQKTVSAERDLEPDAIDDYVDGFADRLDSQNGNAAQMALDAGLVDKVASISEVRADIRKQVAGNAGDAGFRQISQADYLAATDANQPAPRTDSRVALVVVDGTIVDGESVPGSAGGDTVARLVANARRDDHVAALLMRVNSPGGSVTASERIRREIERTRKAGKPVVVSMAGLAASGGYWISMNANQIWAQPSTITGSIGIFAVVPTFGKPLEKLGIHVDGVGTTPLAGSLRLDRPLSPPVKTMLQAGVERGYETFVGHVAAARGLPMPKVKEIAQGRVWSGADAKNVGLVDKLGGFMQAEHAAAKLAGLQEGDYALVPMQPPSDWRSTLRELLSSQVQSALLPDWLTRLGDDDALAWLRTGLNDPHHLYARCFCALEQRSGAASRPTLPITE